MILGTADSVNGVPIRLTYERWEHILYRRPDMASFIETVLDAVVDPEYILRGYKGTLDRGCSFGRAFLFECHLSGAQPYGWLYCDGAH